VLDRERLCSSAAVCRAQIDVTVTPVRLLRVILVTVVIDDVNDNAPAFPVSSVTVSVYELAPPGSRFPLPIATHAYDIMYFPLPVAIDADFVATAIKIRLNFHYEYEVIRVFNVPLPVAIKFDSSTT